MLEGDLSYKLMQILLFGRTANFFAFFGQISDPREWKVVQI